VLLGSSLAVGWRMRPGLALRHGFIWLGIIGLLMVGYSYRDVFRAPFDKVAAELNPARGQALAGGALAVTAAQGGHFKVAGAVNGTPVRFVVDTGASSVVLTQADARRVGLDPDSLAYTLRVGTANGVTTAAPVRLAELSLGPIILRDVRAVVNAGALDRSLLGMTALNQLSAFSVQGDQLILYP